MFILTVRTHCVEFSCKTCLYLSCYRNCKDLDSFKYIHRHGHTLLLMNNLCRMPNKQKGERHATREYNETSQKGRNVDITLQNSFRVWVKYFTVPKIWNHLPFSSMLYHIAQIRRIPKLN